MLIKVDVEALATDLVDHIWDGSQVDASRTRIEFVHRIRQALTARTPVAVVEYPAWRSKAFQLIGYCKSAADWKLESSLQQWGQRLNEIAQELRQALKGSE